MLDSLRLTELVGVRHGGLVLGCVSALIGARVGRGWAVGLEKLVVDETLHPGVRVVLQHVRGRDCEHPLVLSVLNVVLLPVEPLSLVSASVSNLVLSITVSVLPEPAVTLVLTSVSSLMVSVLREPVLLPESVLVAVGVGISVRCEAIVR